jgi:hypothetical protein
LRARITPRRVRGGAAQPSRFHIGNDDDFPARIPGQETES